ncbi:MAG: thioredoxin domain-containing protein [Candidatus Aenigmarchaeota archaeon]|nr:thioredoxin domain-containing protein [Candidatus Aenigmarchaeota archaeon]
MAIECSECKRSFDTNEALTQHKKSKHEEVRSRETKINKNYVIVGALILIIILASTAALYSVPKPYSVKTVDTDNYEGNSSATVTVVEFSDFQCPFCARFYKTTEQEIKEKYIIPEKIKFVYKQFPLDIHSNAQKAAEASECAKDLGGEEAFWKIHDKMFENNEFLSISNLKKFASELNLNTTNFDSCLDSGAMADRVAADLKEGKKLGVSGTPAFFVSGKLIEGAQPFTIFQKAIDSELSK